MENKGTCKGCVCFLCSQSEKQGDVYGCNRCRRCQGVRLMSCDKATPVDDKHEPGGLRL